MPGRNDKNSLGFQLEEKMGQVRREWRMQRIAWPLLYALLAACVLGLFGQGPLSRTEARSADGRLQMEFERFLRRESDDSIDFTLRPAGSSARLRLSSAWVGKVDIDHVFPEPEQRVSGADAVTLVFNTQAQQPVRVRVRLRAQEMGRLPGWAALDDGAPLQFRQFVYP
jgi:hypothetical protein